MFRRCRRICGTGFFDTGGIYMTSVTFALTHFTQDEPGDGLFTEGCYALVEGEYTEDACLEIIAIGQPPCEPRSTAR